MGLLGAVVVVLGIVPILSPGRRLVDRLLRLGDPADPIHLLRPRSALTLPIMYERRWHPLRRLSVLLAVLLAWVLLIAFVAQPFVVPSSSMTPTVRPGDRLLVSKVSFGDGVDRGEIIVFRDPGGWLPVRPHRRSQAARLAERVGEGLGVVTPDDPVLVKRVIGIGGDRVRCCDRAGRVTVNGVPLNESAYLWPLDVPSRVPFSVTVPFGHVWVMGDNRSGSSDSRAHRDSDTLGTVDENLIIGRAVAVLWPPKRVGALRVPAAFQGLPSPMTVVRHAAG